MTRFYGQYAARAGRMPRAMRYMRMVDDLRSGWQSVRDIADRYGVAMRTARHDLNCMRRAPIGQHMRMRWIGGVRHWRLEDDAPD